MHARLRTEYLKIDLGKLDPKSLFFFILGYTRSTLPLPAWSDTQLICMHIFEPCDYELQISSQMVPQHTHGRRKTYMIATQEQ